MTKNIQKSFIHLDQRAKNKNKKYLAMYEKKTQKKYVSVFLFEMQLKLSLMT